MKNITLNTGITMPMIGSGTNTFGKIGNVYTAELTGDTREVDMAIANGYRHFDTAQSYRNEEMVGNALANSSIPRNEFFITTKLRTSSGYEGKDWARGEIEDSLKKLQTDYIDLFLIHHPWDNFSEMVEAWGILEEYYKRGVFKAIGVSNFEKDHLDNILENSDSKPAVNQIESHINGWNDELIEYNKANDIVTVAWSPLSGITDSSRQILDKIGQQYGKTFVQVILRYQIERDVVVIPKSHNKDHQAESLDIFDFELSNEDRRRIAQL